MREREWKGAEERRGRCGCEKEDEGGKKHSLEISIP